MKSVLILLSVLITLSQTDDYVDKDLNLQTGDSIAKYADNNFINKYLKRRSVRNHLDTRIEGKVQRAGESSELRNDLLMNNKLPHASRWSYKLDPILNRMSRRNYDLDSDSEPITTSGELKDLKQEWEALWNKTKLEAKNYTTMNLGDSVNMAAARPWGVSCGDPTEHDLPWGSCVLPDECNAGYRIYKGDYFCGRTQYVCCSLDFHSYDVYQGLDASLEQSSTEFDSAEERAKAKTKSPEQRQKEAARRKRKRKRIRQERKRKIKRTIAKIINEVRRVLDKASANVSKLRKRKTMHMKKFVKFLKKKFKLDRDSVKDIHEHQMVEVDQDFMNKLMLIKRLNSNFMTNDTFRNVVVNRTISLRSAEILAESYPELYKFIPKTINYNGPLLSTSQKGDLTRRRGTYYRPTGYVPRLRGAIVRHTNPRSRRKYLDYDVEYGLMYT